jgi:hypothetical protein
MVSRFVFSNLVGLEFGLEQRAFDGRRLLSYPAATCSSYLGDEVIEPFLQAKVKERTVAQFAATVAQLNRHVKEYIGIASAQNFEGSNEM